MSVIGDQLKHQVDMLLSGAGRRCGEGRASGGVVRQGNGRVALLKRGSRSVVHLCPAKGNSIPIRVASKAVERHGNGIFFDFRHHGDVVRVVRGAGERRRRLVDIVNVDGQRVRRAVFIVRQPVEVLSHDQTEG